MAIYSFELDAYGNLANLGHTLREFGQKIRHIDAQTAGSMPLDLDEVHGVIVSGGASSSGASTPAIEAFVREAVKAEIPVLAIGAGSRLVARALGGEVGPCTERGVVKVSLNGAGREEPLFAGQRWWSEQVVWNDECVTKLPEGARAFASTPNCKVASWGMGPWIFAVDWHVEWDAAGLAEATKATGGISATQVAEIERVGRLFAERVSLCFMPVDRMVSGRAKDVRH
jgi:GMP synthase-like glutamine amidotransferase